MATSAHLQGTGVRLTGVCWGSWEPLPTSVSPSAWSPPPPAPSGGWGCHLLALRGTTQRLTGGSVSTVTQDVLIPLPGAETRGVGEGGSLQHTAT